MKKRRQYVIALGFVELTHLVGISAQRDTESTRKTKVSQLEVTLLVDEQVLWLEISVQNAVGVAVVDAANELEGEFLREGPWSV